MLKRLLRGACAIGGRCVHRWALAVGTVIAVLAVPSAAAAVSRTVDYGRAGRVDTFVVRGWWSLSGNVLQVPGPEVHRTRGTRRTRRSAQGTQRICVTYELYKFTAGYYSPPWPLEADRRRCVNVARGYYQPFSSWNYSAQPYVGWSVNIVVSWSGNGGRRLGRAVYDYDDPEGDYQCQTIKCSTFYGYDEVAAIFFDL